MKLHKLHYKNGAITAGVAIVVVLTLFFLIRFASH